MQGLAAALATAIAARKFIDAMPDDTKLTGEAMVAMLLFSASSASLLLINKLCMHHLPSLPSFISSIQFFCATATCLFLSATGLADVDGWEWSKVQPYLYYVGMFVATIYCNMKALEHSNVETIIVFRACCPLFVCVLDWAFLGRQLPSMRSMASLIVLLLGACGYVLSDRAFKLNGWAAYSWATAYLLIISVEMAYGKHIVGKHLGFKTMWGPTMYTNTLSLPPMLTIGVLSGEHLRLPAAVWTPYLVFLVTVSCVIGVSISYTGWRARSLITATCYTVLGVANKMLTVFANVLIWDKHASIYGIVSLAVCLLGASSYKQAPLRDGYDEAASGAIGGEGIRKHSSSISKVVIVGVAAFAGGYAGCRYGLFEAVPDLTTALSGAQQQHRAMLRGNRTHAAFPHVHSGGGGGGGGAAGVAARLGGAHAAHATHTSRNNRTHTLLPRSKTHAPTAARPPSFSSRTKPHQGTHQGEKAASAFAKLGKPKSSSVARGRATATGGSSPPVPMMSDSNA